MNARTRIGRMALAFGLPALALQAQNWDLAFRLQTTQHSGDSSEVRNATTGFGGGFEASRPFAGGRVVLGLGYLVLPGTQTVVSSYPKKIAASGVDNSVYESRLRMTEAKGFTTSALYRMEVLTEGLYVQGGLRLGFYRSTQRDAGTRLTTNGGAVDASKPDDPNIKRVDTIASIRDTSTVSPEAVIGAGYAFNKNYALELNLSNHRLKTPQGSASGFGSDIALAVRF